MDSLDAFLVPCALGPLVAAGTAEDIAIQAPPAPSPFPPGPLHLSPGRGAVTEDSYPQGTGPSKFVTWALPQTPLLPLWSGPCGGRAL